ncbi:MAG: hypothetical protein BGO01_16835 [Armatimonadetes bacterium 55-13]|jgi:5-methylcytosine-specific restriction endonuclease McrA|nr:MAG: hypothetical protein BGO01_16835 [Armatimonadetes bacterium 55-13]
MPRCSNPLEERILNLYKSAPIDGAEYYFFTLARSEDGEIIESCYSHFAGFTEEKPRRDLRVASPIRYEVIWRTLNDVGQQPLTIHCSEDAPIWMFLGGHALLASEVAQHLFPHRLKPHPVVIRATGEMVSPELAGEAAERRAPTRKMRMEVFDRDGRRCVICGQSPRNSVQVELEAHHIRPWGMSGLTEMLNLVTLCSACHDGLSPHFDHTLYEHTGADQMRSRGRNLNDYTESVDRYRTHVKALLARELKLGR